MQKRLWLVLAGYVLICWIGGAGLEAAQADGEKIAMFNGKNLDGWVIEGKKLGKGWIDRKPIWSVKDGVIACTGQGYGWLRYDREFDDFVFHVEYRMLHKRSNSGLGIRTVPYTGKRSSRPSFASYEVQLLNDVGKKPSTKCTGSLYRYMAPSAIAIKPMGEWNVVEVRCQGPRIEITFNGQTTLDVDQSLYEKLKKKPLKGYLAIQTHSDPLEFRNLWVQPLSKAAGK